MQRYKKRCFQYLETFFTHHMLYDKTNIQLLKLLIMKTRNLNFWGKSKYWWIILTVGILMVLSGFAYWFWPVAGYAVASQIFGWMLVLAGIVQLCVAAGPDHARGWGWWIAGGVIDMFIGFMLVRSVILSEAVFPYFIAIIFLYWGISAIISSVCQRQRRYWWLYLIKDRKSVV